MHSNGPASLGGSAMTAVADACIAAELIMSSRSRQNRNRIARLVGLTRDELIGIEECWVLPAPDQLHRIETFFGISVEDRYASARPFGRVPWEQAFQELLAGGPADERELVQRLARLSADCKPEVALWRLKRASRRLTDRGFLTRDADNCLCIRSDHTPSSRVTNGRPKTAPWAQHDLHSYSDPEHEALFHIDLMPGAKRIVLNCDHPHYEALHALLELQPRTEPCPRELAELLSVASQLVRDLLAAWAAYEESEKAGSRRSCVREARQGWGREARRLAAARTSSENRD